jgi:hypothetical protein
MTTQHAHEDGGKPISLRHLLAATAALPAAAAGVMMAFAAETPANAFDYTIATYRKVTGRFRSRRGVDLFADIRSVLGTAARRRIDVYQTIRAILRGGSVLQAG